MFVGNLFQTLGCGFVRSAEILTMRSVLGIVLMHGMNAIIVVKVIIATAINV